MYILNYIFSFFTTSAASIKACLTSSRESEEATPLVSERHLSAQFEQFEDSTSAVHAALWHTFFYYLVTVILFSFVVEDFSIIDSLYFASTVFTTVGYGDMSPTNNASRIAVIGLAFWGITLLGVFLGIYGAALVDSNEKAVMKNRQKLQEKMIQDPEQRNGGDIPSEDEETTLLGDILNILFLEGPILLIVIAIGQIVGHYEGWGIIESLYWTVVTATSIGFGDDAPTLTGTRLAGVFFLPFFVAVLGEFLGRVASCYLDQKQRKSEKRFLQQSMTLADLRVMDMDKDGNVDKAEFLAFMLVTLQRVDQEDIDALLQLFHSLDKDKNGAINARDLKIQATQRLRNGMTPPPPSNGGALAV